MTMVSLSKQMALASVTGLALLCLCSPVWAIDGTVRNLHFDPANRHFVIEASGPVKAMVNTLNIAGHKRVIIDLDNAEIGTDLPRDVQLLQMMNQQLPNLRNVTVNQYSGNGRPIVRILLDLQGDPGTIRLVRNQGPQIELEIHENTARATSTPTYSRPESTRPSTPNVRMGEETVSKDLYNRSLLAQQDQKAQIEALQRERDQLQARIRTSADGSLNVDDMKRTLEEMNRRYDSLSQENQRLKNQLAAQSQPVASSTQPRSTEADRLKLESLSQEKQQLQQEITRLKGQLASVQNTATQNTSAASSKTSLSETDLQRLRGQLTLAQQSLNDSIRTINEQNKEIAYLRNQVSDVKAGLDASSREQIARLQTSLDEKDITVRDLQRQLLAKASNGSGSSANSADIAMLKRQLERASQQYQDDVRSLNQQVRDKSAQLQTAQTQVDQLRDVQRENTALKNQLTTANRKVTEGQTSRVPASELQSRDNRIAELQRQLASVQSELSMAKTSKVSTEKASTTVKEAMDRLTRENRDLHSTVDSLKLANQQTSGNSEQLRQLQKQVASLQDDLSDMTEKYNRSVQEVNQTKQAMVSQKNQKSAPAAVKPDVELTRQITDLNAELSRARKENSFLRDSLSSKSTSVSTPTNAEAERDYQEGKAALAAKDINKALDKLKEAYLLDSDNSRYATDYSMALAEDHQYADAIDTLRRFLQKHPADREVYNQLGKLYLLNDDANAANQAFTRALPISTLNNYATSLKKLGRIQDAENVFKLALSINPKDSEVLFNLGNLYNSENKLEQARNKYLEAIQLKPDFAEAHYNLGLIFSKLGDNTKAVSHLEKFLQLSPNARNAETIRAYVQKLKA